MEITQVSLKDFLGEWSDVIAQKVNGNLSPVYNPLDNEVLPDFDEKLSRSLRKPFAAQEAAIKALAKYFYKEGQSAAILNGSMGTGKTLISILTAYLSPKPLRVGVLCPPHITKKWLREVRKTIAEAKIENLSTRDAIEKLTRLRDTVYGTEARTPEFYILSRERAKAGYWWSSAFVASKDYRSKAPKASRTSVVTDSLYLRCSSCGNPIREILETKETGEIVFGITPVSSEELQKRKHFCKATIGYRVIVNDGQNTRIKYRRVPLKYNSLDETEKLQPIICEAPLWTATQKLRRISPADFIRQKMKGFFDLLICDEFHEYKAGNSIQGNALGSLAASSGKILGATGTLMAGYADNLFYLLWRISPRSIKEDGFEYGDDTAWTKKYGVLETVYYLDPEDAKTGKGKKQDKNLKRRPGISPVAIAKHLLDKTVFLTLDDMSDEMPNYDEDIVLVDMHADQAEAYKSLEQQLQSAASDYSTRMDMMSKMLQALLSYPDSCVISSEEITVKAKDRDDDCYIDRVIAKAPQIRNDRSLPKEQAIIDACLRDKALGRKVLIPVVYTDTRDITLRLQEQLRKAGLNFAILRTDKVGTDEREQWFADQVEAGVDGIIGGAEGMKTGLDLLDFPSIYLFQVGYNVYTLLQVSQRSNRCNQDKDVIVRYFVYANTMQEQALYLVADKIETSRMVQGIMLDSGLAAMCKLQNSIIEDLARSLVGRIRNSAEQAWKKLRDTEAAHKRQRSLPPAATLTEHSQRVAAPDANQVLATRDYQPATMPAIVPLEVGTHCGKKNRRRFLGIPREDLDEFLASNKEEPVQFMLFEVA